MANFTVRVELHNAKSTDYDELHDKMKKKGFKKTISTNDGKEYSLPSAEYNYPSDSKDKYEVCDLAYGIAKTVKKNPSVLVTKSDGRTWRGLDEI
ncbi:type V toxin-antitoxin system endoribonuclease antitoxin GhoS [Xenorhabdus sp. XENO-1]|uniref:type V toxin-antitoxin system endoribonuclease antitoxin GhoS n=1 Tax=Xenorhabdus bovienii TaxID=40576 RepID=UPI0020CA8918|nr:type V toxin-antitoxin system endoribonuclease antitoxin GhoS [Xenorhabdus bovienii]MCP9269865.1 type V toxin-antitoxin system endoribonuclease antitoxin GhoS [Xenorhabdus bovienii subsp. africana]